MTNHTVEKQHFQTDDLLWNYILYHKVCPLSPLLQINGNNRDLHYLLHHSMSLKTWSYLLSPLLMFALIPKYKCSWLDRTVKSLSQAHLCLSLRPSCQLMKHKLSERYLLLIYQSCLMLSSDFKRYWGDWSGQGRKGVGQVSGNQQSSFLRKPGSKLYNSAFSEAKLIPCIDKSQLGIFKIRNPPLRACLEPIKSTALK